MTSLNSLHPSYDGLRSKHQGTKGIRFRSLNFKKPSKVTEFKYNGKDIEFEDNGVAYRILNVAKGFIPSENQKKSGMRDGSFFYREKNIRIVPLFTDLQLSHVLKKTREEFDLLSKNGKNSWDCKKAVQQLKHYVHDEQTLNQLDRVLSTQPQEELDDLFDAIEGSDYNDDVRNHNPRKNYDLRLSFFEYLVAKRVTLTKERTYDVLRLAIAYNDAALLEKCIQADPTLLSSSIKPFYGRNLSLIELGIELKAYDAVRYLLTQNISFEKSDSQDLIKTIYKITQFCLKKNQEEVDILFYCFKVCIEHGAPFEHLQTNQGEGGIEAPIIEDWYFNPAFRKFADYLIFQTNTPLTPSILNDLRMNRLPTFSEREQQALIARGVITQEELAFLIPSAEQETELLPKTWFATERLKTESRITHGNVMGIDPRVILEVKERKKALKQYILNHPEDGAARELYEQLVKIYDPLIERHSIFRISRLFSQQLRNYKKTEQKELPSKEAGRIFSLLSGLPHTMTLGSSQRHLQNNSAVSSMSLVVQSVQNTLPQATSANLPPISWVHGTKTSSLPGILDKQGLHPLGQLLDGSTVPFNGENCGSEMALNKDRVSGEILTPHLQALGKKSLYHDASTLLLTALLYAMKKTGYGDNDKKFDIEKIKALLTKENFAPVLHKLANGGLASKEFSGIRLAILRLRQYDPTFDVAELLSMVEEKLRTHSQSRHQLEELKRVLTIPTRALTEREKKWIAEEPSPIVFASSTLEPVAIDTELEYVVPNAAFKRDIQYAFTSPERVEELQSVLGPLGIEVYPLDLLLMQEAAELSQGTRREELLIAQAQGKLSSQALVSELLEEEILPFYSKPLPPAPSYRNDEGSRVLVRSPFYGGQTYEAYRKAYEEGRGLARSIHGRVHATRVAILVQILNNMQGLPPLTYDQILAAAAHDWMRQDEGEDHWDRESGERFYALARKLHVSPDAANALQQAMIHKDPPKKEFFSTFHRCLHDADCMDIVRVLRDPEAFRPTELTFHRKIDAKLEDDLIREWIEWCSLTESETFKRAIEWHSDANYADMMAVLWRLREQFPTLSSYLSKELQEFAHREIPAALR